MKTMEQARELARRFNEDEAVWRAFERRGERRRLPGSHTAVPDEVLDRLDWDEAERECREVRAVGFSLPQTA